MSDEHPTDLLGALPRTRPHRRSDKRPARAAAEPARVKATAPRAKRPPEPAAPTSVPIVRTAVQAAAELAEIGLSLGARALRGAAGRLPRP